MQELNTSYYGQHNIQLDYSQYSNRVETQLLGELDAYIEEEAVHLRAVKDRVNDSAKFLLNHSNYKYNDQKSLKESAAQGRTYYYNAWSHNKFHEVFSKVFDFEFKCEQTHSKPGYAIDGSSDFSIRFKKSNPLVFLMPDLDYTVPEIKCDPHLNSIYETKKYSDIAFSIEGREVKAHRLILSKLPYFDVLFSRWSNDNQNAALVELPEFSFADFDFVMKYIYTGEIDEGYFSIPQNCLSLLKTATMLEFEPLRTIAKFHLFAQKNRDIFLDVALFSLNLAQDDDLALYCSRFFEAFPSYVDELDLSGLQSGDLRILIEIGKKYRQENLIEKAENALNGVL